MVTARETGRQSHPSLCKLASLGLRASSQRYSASWSPAAVWVCRALSAVGEPDQKPPLVPSLVPHIARFNRSLQRLLGAGCCGSVSWALP